MAKQCSLCGCVKPLSEFYVDKAAKSGIRSSCKVCTRKYMNQRAAANRTLIRARNQQYYQQNKVVLREKQRQYYAKNVAEIREKKKTAAARLKRQVWERRYFRGPQARLAKILRRRLYMAIRNNQKQGSAVKLLGCSISVLKDWLEAKFYANMCWDNYGVVWHIDHVRPFAVFDLENFEQLKQACHYSNLQPLLIVDNLYKGAKLLEEHELEEN